MSSPRERAAELARFYTVTDAQRHPRGHTVYKVTARVVSRRNPEDVQEIIVWKRYSDFKKLHKELWQIHKNLFRHSELFPPFAKGKVFGRFDATVIEERRQCAEDLLQFSANIPALYNSQQLGEFFRGGVIHDGSELIGPLDACPDSLTDSFAECSTEGESSPTRREAVKRRTAEYLLRAESLSSLRRKAPPGGLSRVQPPGSVSSRPAGSPRSPAEELKAFRVLGVIDKVLLVMDTRTEQTFILKGLRKSSAGGGGRRTIIPRRVPHMVRLHKYIVSDESVFLVLQHAEGGKLWSYIGRFLSRSPENTLAAEAVGAHSPRQVPGQLPVTSPQAAGGVGPGASGTPLGALALPLPLQMSLQPRSQEGSQLDEEEEEEEPEEEEDGQASSPRWSGSGSSSEEGCTSSYSTLCKEYGREQVEPGALSEELLWRPEDGRPAPLTAESPPRALGLGLCPRDGDLEAASSAASRGSPLDLFRIDSKDSASELLGLELAESPGDLLSPATRPGGCEDDSVPVISFKDAALDASPATEEGRPDLLVNLPAGLEAARVVPVGPATCSMPPAGLGDSRLLEAPDVLCLGLSPEPSGESEEGTTEEGGSSFRPQSQWRTEEALAMGSVLAATVDSDQKLGEVGSARGPSCAEESGGQATSCPADPAGHQADTDLFQTEEVLLFAEHAPGDKAFGSLGLPSRDSEATAESWTALTGDGEIHQIFEALDKQLALHARFSIPEGCVQRWAAEMVVALDALHREGIVCRDLNPNNILLNDRGHIQLTYFSRWSEVEDPCDSDAMERLYCAPEVGAITEETEACDWWSLGAMLFELLTGKTLLECHPAGISTHTTVDVPGHVSEEARSLVQQLLQFNPVERLGAGAAGVEDIKSHPFFTPVDWAALTG
ncbi:ribosomal protein S6 kinase delta-1 isoform X2 [Sorex araneus]|uniref:ribosomal protein S6 kinase delta-1 isoform X2 n=1 Tax=Sorex araneus TaxID=42254 RepID=UPI002433AE5F|nr:ribosomal protein S6 kinase delta-1 isoform X2 [Sorex araneus]